MQNKAVLRKKMLEKRQALSLEEISAHAEKIAAKLIDIIPKCSNLAAYFPIKGEVDAFSIASALTPETLALPCIKANSKELVFRQFKAGDALEKGEYDIHRPDQDSPVIIPDIILVPLVAFDTKGHRLGYGGGYYDTTITSLRRTNANLKAIGVAYAFQQVEHLTSEPHDARLDMVITEHQHWKW